jgi:hypothetical protein
MAEVEPGRRHGDKRADGTPKQLDKYPVKVFYHLRTPLPVDNPKLKSGQGPVYTKQPEADYYHIWEYPPQTHGEYRSRPPMDDDMKRINQPDGILLPSVNDTWEAIPIDPWAEEIPQHTYEPTIIKLRPETPDARIIAQLPTEVALMVNDETQAAKEGEEERKHARLHVHYCRRPAPCKWHYQY